MNEPTNQESRSNDDEVRMESLKNFTAAVYLCQVLAFAFAGLPLLVGVAINFFKRNEVKGTWLESHFNWQIKTFWLTFLLLALTAFTSRFGTIGMIVLTITVLLLGYRIALGWYALNSNKPIQEDSAG